MISMQMQFWHSAWLISGIAVFTIYPGNRKWHIWAENTAVGGLFTELIFPKSVSVHTRHCPPTPLSFQCQLWNNMGNCIWAIISNSLGDTSFPRCTGNAGPGAGLTFHSRIYIIKGSSAMIVNLVSEVQRLRAQFREYPSATLNPNLLRNVWRFSYKSNLSNHWKHPESTRMHSILYITLCIQYNSENITSISGRTNPHGTVELKTQDLPLSTNWL